MVLFFYMDIAALLRDVEEKFEVKKSEREKYTQSAEECLMEMTKLQGEWRLLTNLMMEQNKKIVKVNKQATVIEAVPEKASK